MCMFVVVSAKINQFASSNELQILIAIAVRCFFFCGDLWHLIWVCISIFVTLKFHFTNKFFKMSTKLANDDLISCLPQTKYRFSVLEYADAANKATNYYSIYHKVLCLPIFRSVSII